MEAQNQEVAALVEKIAGLHAAISKLPSLSPSAEVDALFTDLVTACVPASPVDVAKLGPEAQAMREELIRLCSAAEGHLEAHYADMLAAFDNPLDHLARFPYYGNYVNLSKLEYDLLVRYVPGIAPTRVAFVGSGPLPFSSLVLAAHHLPDADIRRAGSTCWPVYHPDDEVINSVIVARKADPRRGGGLAGARGAVPVVSPPCKCCKMEAAAGAFQKAEEFAAKRLSV
uniref:Nicotianamine synthase n=1 Tax=Oryza barthii TaxID=65489 RepID=A0A0D3FHK8_9ORYZ